MLYTFGDIVVVNGENIGVVVKCWNAVLDKEINKFMSYDVYIRNYNGIKTFKESEIERYLVRHKYLSKEEKEYQYNAVNSI